MRSRHDFYNKHILILIKHVNALAIRNAPRRIRFVVISVKNRSLHLVQPRAARRDEVQGDIRDGAGVIALLHRPGLCVPGLSIAEWVSIPRLLKCLANFTTSCEPGFGDAKCGFEKASAADRGIFPRFEREAGRTSISPWKTKGIREKGTSAGWANMETARGAEPSTERGAMHKNVRIGFGCGHSKDGLQHIRQ